MVDVAEGKSFRDAAKACGLSDSSVQTIKRQLAAALKEYMGADILITISRNPGWKNGIIAAREKQACRDERRN